ncbi:MAG: hypothetical protein IV104_14030 [Acidovorax sp.]|nr:hypothetical protein [Acidovorax sp.]
MKRIIFLFSMMCALNMSFAQRCESFKFFEKSEILSDGGSINLVFKMDCNRRDLVNYAASLDDVNILSVDGVEIKIGSIEEAALLVKIDLFLKSKIGENHKKKSAKRK